VADFNRNGKTDYLLVKASTHRSAIWYPSVVIFVGGVYELTFANDYELKGAADFNGESSPDYVPYNPSTRRTAIWYLNNNVAIGSAYGPTLSAGWSLVAP
jgi:hypothetical protein